MMTPEEMRAYRERYPVRAFCYSVGVVVFIAEVLLLILETAHYLIIRIGWR